MNLLFESSLSFMFNIQGFICWLYWKTLHAMFPFKIFLPYYCCKAYFEKGLQILNILLVNFCHIDIFYKNRYFSRAQLFYDHEILI